MMSTLSSSVGAMLTAASVMISVSAYDGTSITKQWLMRRAVRRPGFALHHRAHQLVGVQAALHQRLRLAFAHELDRLRRPRPGCTARRRSSSLRDVDAVLLRHGLDARLAARPGSARSARASPHRPRPAASSRRTGARRRSAWAAAPCSKSSSRSYFVVLAFHGVRPRSRRACGRACAPTCGPVLRGAARSAARAPAATAQRPRRCCSIIASCSVESASRRCTRSSASRRSHQRQQPLAVGGVAAAAAAASRAPRSGS